MRGDVLARWCGLILFLLVAVPCAGEYRTTEVASLRIVMDSDWVTITAPGYVPVRFDITNVGEARVIEIVGESLRFSRSMRSGPVNTRMQIRQALRMARGDRVRLTIAVPVSGDSETTQFRILEDGRTLEQFNYSGLQSAVAATNAAVLIVAEESSPFGKAAASWPPRPYAASMTYLMGSMSAGVPRPVARGAAGPKLDVLLEPSRLPATWLGYTSLRAVVIGPSEWTALDDAQKGALLTWTACGGDLILVDAPPDALVGGGHRTPEAASSGAARAYFFGRIHRRTTASIAEHGLNGVLKDATAVQDGDWSLPANRWARWATITARGFRLPIPGVADVPARAYLGILLLFSVVIGPLNYWMLWRKRRQVLFVLTAPLVSALFILLLAGYVIAGEGLHVSARTESFTMLDQARKQAVTRATVSLYAAGMTPADGLNYPRDVAVYTIGADGFGSRTDQTLDLTDSQRFTSGAIEARAATNIEQISFRAARERLTFTAGAGSMSVTNGLGAIVNKLIVRRGGKVYVLTNRLAEAATGTLTVTAVEGRTFVPGDLPRAYRFIHLVDNLPEGAYLAVLERSPFWDAGASVVERDSFHVVIGWIDGQP